MCDFCNGKYSTKGMMIGKEMKINQCATDTDLKDCQVYIHNEDKPSVIIFDKYGMARGYFEIKCCPKCGRKLV